MLDKILTKFENVVVFTTFSVLTVLAFANVVSRYLLHASIAWSNELIIGLAVYMIMVGSSGAVREGAHPGFTVLRDSTRGILHKIVVIAIAVAMAGFFLALLWLGMEMVGKQLNLGRTTPALGISQWVLSLAIPLGAVFGTIRTVQMAVTHLRHPETEATASEILPGG